MQNQTVSCLLLDVGGVLLTNGWDHNSRKKAVEKFGLDAEETESRHHMTFDTYETGKLSLDEYLERTVFYEPRSFSMAEFREFMFEQSQPFPEMILLIRSLKKKYGLRVGVVSNEGKELTRHRLDTFRLGEFVDFFIFSCFVHLRKPDADIFRLALDVSQVKPQEIIYLDDRDLFVQVAAKLGINAFTHSDVRTTAAMFAGFGFQA